MPETVSSRCPSTEHLRRSIGGIGFPGLGVACQCRLELLHGGWLLAPVLLRIECDFCFNFSPFHGLYSPIMYGRKESGE